MDTLGCESNCVYADWCSRRTDSKVLRGGSMVLINRDTSFRDYFRDDKFYDEARERFAKDAEENMRIINGVHLSMETFKKKELACRCCGELRMTDKFLFILQSFSYFLGYKYDKHIRLLAVREGSQRGSGYRCYRHNKKVGGVEKSQHNTDGISKLGAVDLDSPDLTAEQLFKDAMEFGLFRTIIFYQRSKFVHLDINPARKETKAWTWDK